MTETMFSIKCATIGSILDPSEILCKNWGLRKVIYWTLYLSIAGFAVVAQLWWNWWATFVSIVHFDMLWLGILLFLIEPLMILLAIVGNGLYPTRPKVATQRPKMVDGRRKMVKVNAQSARRRKNKEVAIVVACHNSRDIIPNTVRACLQHVKPQQIYIVDNGNSDKPTDDSKQVLQQISPRSHYIWNGYGNKTLAQYAGVMACKKYKYILVLDDDVILPEDLQLGQDLIEGNTVGVVYPIRACHPERKYSLFVEWQSLEYQLTGYNKLLQHKSGTVHYPHGAASMWERSALKKALRSHDTIFYGEDAKLGIWAMKNGFDLKMKPEVVIYTESPHSILGTMPNFWTQRVRSWDMALHCYLWQYIEVFLCTAHGSIFGTLLMKLTQGYTVFSILADWLRLPVVVIGIGMGLKFIYYFGLYLGVAVLMLFLWNYIAYWRRPDLRLSFFCIMTYPIYACIVLVTRFFGLLRAFFIYLPNYKRPPRIPEIEDSVIEQWNKACLDEEKAGGGGYDYDSDEGSTESSDSNDVREPVWLAEEAFELTTCASSNGQDGLSVSVMESPVFVHGNSRASSRANNMVGKDLSFAGGPSSIRQSRNSRGGGGGGYRTPYDLQSQRIQDPPRRSAPPSSMRRSSRGPVDLDDMPTARPSAGPVDLDDVTDHVQQKPYRSPHYKQSGGGGSAKTRPADSVQRWMKSVNDGSDRRVRFSGRDQNDDYSEDDDDTFMRGEC